MQISLILKDGSVLKELEVGYPSKPDVYVYDVTSPLKTKRFQVHQRLDGSFFAKEVEE